MICMICHKEFSDTGIGKHVWRIHDISASEYYDKYIHKSGNCVICGKKTRFISINQGYVRTCSEKCGLILLKKNNLKKYGCENPFGNEEIKKKIRKTNKKKYGSENPLQNNEIKKKQQRTNKRKYGCENPFGSDDIKKKIKRTNKRKYGCENPFGNEEIKKKIRKTNKKKYGSENPFGSKIIQDKIKKNNKKNYGVEYPAQRKDVKLKAQKTNIVKYGVKHPLQNKKVLRKAIKSKEISLNNLHKKGFDSFSEFLFYGVFSKLFKFYKSKNINKNKFRFYHNSRNFDFAILKYGVPKLLIELDGTSHDKKYMKEIGMTRKSIKSRINNDKLRKRDAKPYELLIINTRCIEKYRNVRDIPSKLLYKMYLKIAEKLGVKIINEQQFNKMCK